MGADSSALLALQYVLIVFMDDLEADPVCSAVTDKLRRSGATDRVTSLISACWRLRMQGEAR